MSPSEQLEEGADLKIADLMQKELLERACSRAHAFTHEDRLAATLEWVDAKAGKFRALLSERPELKDMFAENREAALREIEEAIDERSR